MILWGLGVFWLGEIVDAGEGPFEVVNPSAEGLLVATYHGGNLGER